MPHLFRRRGRSRTERPASESQQAQQASTPEANQSLSSIAAELSSVSVLSARGSRREPTVERSEATQSNTAANHLSAGRQTLPRPTTIPHDSPAAAGPSQGSREMDSSRSSGSASQGSQSTTRPPPVTTHLPSDRYNVNAPRSTIGLRAVPRTHFEINNDESCIARSPHQRVRACNIESLEGLLFRIDTDQNAPEATTELFRRYHATRLFQSALHQEIRKLYTQRREDEAVGILLAICSEHGFGAVVQRGLMQTHNMTGPRRALLFTTHKNVAAAAVSSPVTEPKQDPKDPLKCSSADLSHRWVLVECIIFDAGWSPTSRDRDPILCSQLTDHLSSPGEPGLALRGVLHDTRFLASLCGSVKSGSEGARIKRAKIIDAWLISVGDPFDYTATAARWSLRFPFLERHLPELRGEPPGMTKTGRDSKWRIPQATWGDEVLEERFRASVRI